MNAIMDACYLSSRSKKWEPVELDLWRGSEKADTRPALKEFDADHYLIKEEKMPDGTKKRGQSVSKIKTGKYCIFLEDQPTIGISRNYALQIKESNRLNSRTNES